MPRGRCHFSILFTFHEQIRVECPEAARLADRHLPDFLAGSVAPDGLRYIGRMGKLATHFYTEDRPEIWGKAVAEMFKAHPEISNPDGLDERDRALVMGYISHLTTDETFRDIVTYQVHGMENWRPVVQGLWSIVDELPIGYPSLAREIRRFNRKDRVGFIDCAKIAQYLSLIRGWADESDPWGMEQIFLELIGSRLSLDEARRAWERNRKRALDFLDDSRRNRFIQRSVEMGIRESTRFLGGEYRGVN